MVKGIRPNIDGVGSLGSTDKAWAEVHAKAVKTDVVEAGTLSADNVDGDLASKLVADVKKQDDAVVVTMADGTSSSFTVTGETTLGFARKRRIEKSGSEVKLWWEDPKDGTATWAKTIIVKKSGSYPETPVDGTVVIETTERDKYKEDPYVDTQENPEDWYYRAFPVSTMGGTSYHNLNRFGFWLFGFSVDRDDAIESTCVKYLAGTDNSDFEPLKMIFTDNVDNNVLDWGDWKDAPFLPKPCALKHTGEVDYYLDPDDYNKKADGTENENIANASYAGEMMMEWGKVFVKVVDGPASYAVYFCSKKLDEGYECYSCKKSGGYNDHFYTPIYEGRVVNNVMRSLSTGIDGKGGYIRTASTAMANEMTYAKANGPGWNIETWADVDLINCLGILVTKRLNVSKAIGYNCGSSTTALTHRIGTANKKGIFFGHYTTSKYATKFFGMENWWGHCWRRCVGLVTDANRKIKVKMTADTSDGSTAEEYNMTGDGFIDTGFIVPAASCGYIVDVLASKYGVTIPKAITKYTGDAGTTTGTASTYYCDGLWAAVSCALIRGGSVSYGPAAGAFAFAVDAAPSHASWALGAALSYHPV